MSKFLLFAAVLLLITTAIESNSGQCLITREESGKIYFNNFKNGILNIVKFADNFGRGKNTQITNKIDVDAVTNEITIRLEKVLKEENQGFCELIQNKFEWVVEPLREQYLNKCAEVFQSLPAYVESIVLSVSDTICKMEVQQLIELSNTCIDNNEIDCLPPRTGEIFVEHWSADKNHTIKMESCQLYDKQRPCIKNHLKKNCKFAKSRDAFLTIFDAALEKIC